MGNNWVVNPKADLSTVTVDRSALGRMASIGDLYDARSDNFCGISVFKKQISERALSLVDSHFSDIHLVHTDNLSEKFSKLEVKSELQVSVLAGLLTLEGSGRYLGDQKKSARTVKSSLIYNIKTKEEKVNIYHEDIKDAFAIEAIESGLATHVVVGTSWGANSVLSCLHKNADKRDVKEIEGNLSAILNKLSVSIRGNASVDFGSGDNSNGVEFDVRIYGDILPKNEDLPTTFEGALALMKQLPRLVENSNEGKGKPLTYRLVPLSLLKDYLKFEIKADNTLKNLEEASLVRVVQLFDQLSSAQQKLNDFYQDAMDYKYCVSQEDMTKICVWKDNLTVQETLLRSKLSSVLTEVRSGKRGATDLEDLINDFQSSDLAPQKVCHLLATWSSLTEKTNLVRTLVQHGAKYIGFGVSFDEVILRCFDSKAYVFYFSDKSASEDAVGWKRNRQLFFHELKRKLEGCQYFAVDCTIHPTLMPQSKSTCTQILQSGVVIIEDYLVEQDRLASIPWAQSILPTERLLYPPNKRISLSIVCTGNSCNPTQVHNWNCTKCENPLEYGFDQHVYCKCGKTPVSGLEFKCPDPKHGLNFQRHEQENFLQQLLDQLRLFPEMNILVIGESCGDKSSWLKGLIDFLTLSSLQQVEVSKLEAVDPSKHDVPNDDTPQDDDNEGNQEGLSETHESKVHAFKLKNTTVHLIDIPVTSENLRGTPQAKLNFQNYLRVLSNFQEIHGICLPVTPASEQLTDMLHFVTKELQNYLAPNISKNIVFCATKFVDPISSLKALHTPNTKFEFELTPNTMYNFQSSVCNVNSPVGTKAVDCWHAWVDEAKRMLLHINSLKPLQILQNHNALIPGNLMLESLCTQICDPNKIFNVPNGEKFECQICYMNKSEHPRDYFVLIKCDKAGGHVFHHSHLADWTNQQRRSCPVCNKPKRTQLHDVRDNPGPKLSVINMKIALVGDIATGKTCLARRYADGNKSLSSHPTFGSEAYNAKLQVGQWKLNLTIWDLSCNERYMNVIQPAIKTFDGIIFCYEKPHFKSLINISKIWKGFINKQNDNYRAIIVECKNDSTKSPICCNCHANEQGFCRPTSEDERMAAGNLLGNATFSVSILSSSQEEVEAPFKYLAMNILANDEQMKKILERNKSTT